MSNVTVSISFQDSLLAAIDAEARREARSELLREAARLYVRRQREWESIFALGRRQSARLGLTERDVARAIRAARARSRKST